MKVNVRGSEIERQEITSDEGFVYTVFLLVENESADLYCNYKIIVTHSFENDLELLSYFETVNLEEAKRRYNNAIEIAKRIA